MNKSEILAFIKTNIEQISAKNLTLHGPGEGNQRQLKNVTIDDHVIRCYDTKSGKDVSIAIEHLDVISDAFERCEIFNIDEIFKGTGNFRATLEAILVNIPGVIFIPGNSRSGESRKRLSWSPEFPQALGTIKIVDQSSEEYKQIITKAATTIKPPALTRIEHVDRCIIPKPFLILAGISGTGKTRWVRKIAERTGDGKSNIRLISVRPDWHEPSDLLGYTSRISSVPEFVSTLFLTFLVEAWKNAWTVEQTLAASPESVEAMTPHWVCLDEMNLAPVEQYFADFLSVLELRSWDTGKYECESILSLDGRSESELASIRTALFGTTLDDEGNALWEAFLDASEGRKPGIPLPPNLIVVGTVNMDETTHSFSRKVLDRAFTVEFDTFSTAQYRKGTGIDPVLGIELSDDVKLPATAVLSTTTSGTGVTGAASENVGALIDSWNGIMAETPFRVAFRTLNESLLYAASKGEDHVPEAIDDILMMKLLPRLEGDTDKLGYDGDSLAADEAFDKLGEARNTLIHAAWQVAKIAIRNEFWPKSKSKKKLHYMAKRLARTGYTSFWP